MHKKSKSDEASSKEVLEKIIPLFEAISDWCDENIMAAQTGLAESMGVKNAKVMWPVRIAAAGTSRPAARWRFAAYSAGGNSPPPSHRA